MNGIVYPYGSSHLINTSSDYHTTMNGVDKVKIPGRNEIPATTLIQLRRSHDKVVKKSSTFFGRFFLAKTQDVRRKSHLKMSLLMSFFNLIDLTWVHPLDSPTCNVL